MNSTQSRFLLNEIDPRPTMSRLKSIDTLQPKINSQNPTTKIKFWLKIQFLSFEITHANTFPLSSSTFLVKWIWKRVNVRLGKCKVTLSKSEKWVPRVFNKQMDLADYFCHVGTQGVVYYLKNKLEGVIGPHQRKGVS